MADERLKKEADALVEQGSKLLDKSKVGHSEAAANRLTMANIILKEAGLIKGPLMKL